MKTKQLLNSVFAWYHELIIKTSCLCYLPQPSASSPHMSNIHKRIPIVKKPSPMEPLVKKSPFVKEALRFAPLEKEAADRYSICKLHILTPQGRAWTICRLVPLIPMVPLEQKTADRCSICKLHILTPEGRAWTICRLVPLVPMVLMDKEAADRCSICKLHIEKYLVVR